MRQVGLLAVLGAAVLAIAAACDVAAPVTTTAENYPLPNDPPDMHMFVPAELGVPARAYVLDLRVRPGDRIELLDAHPIGEITGADVNFYLSRAPDPSQTSFEPLEPVTGAVVTNSSTQGDQTVGIIAEITPREAGRFELTDVRLSYRVNDGIAEQADGITTTLAVCGGTPICASP